LLISDFVLLSFFFSFLVSYLFVLFVNASPLSFPSPGKTPHTSHALFERRIFCNEIRRTGNEMEKRYIGAGCSSFPWRAFFCPGPLPERSRGCCMAANGARRGRGVWICDLLEVDDDEGTTRKSHRIDLL
jgi:hypothetical protein